MGNKVQKTAKVLFFGAGKVGKRWIRQFKYMGIEPEGIIDNNELLWGTMCEDIAVCNPAKILTFCYEYIYITCAKENEIFCQLLELGVPEEKIIAGSFHILNHLIYQASENRIFNDIKTGCCTQNTDRKIVFDLYNGMVLGGVESWSYMLAKKLKRKGHQGIFLTTDAEGPAVIDKTYPAYMLRYSGIQSEKDKIVMCVKKIEEHLPCVVICNFPQHIFWSACIVKKRYPDQIRIIAVQHNDECLYYNAYSLWKNYIDRCMVLSSCMKKKLLSFGMERNKIRNLEWEIPCRETMKRTGRKRSACLQLGYAGRVTITQKRIDLLLILAQNLKKRGHDFRINIAGSGDYSETLQRKIEEEGLSDYVIPVGYIDRKDIPDFWNRQDIMVSCSEYEGHSISQSEAMAEGAVPVITDVSGAKDDVTDGYNGFIVAVGDVETLTDRVSYLYYNREVLEQMGTCAHNTIYNRQKDLDQAVFWDDLLKEVWEQ